MKLNDKDLTKVAGGASYENKGFSFNKGEKIYCNHEKTSYLLVKDDYVDTYKDKKIKCQEIRASDGLIINDSPFITAQILYYMFVEYGAYN